MAITSSSYEFMSFWSGQSTSNCLKVFNSFDISEQGIKPEREILIPENFPFYPHQLLSLGEGRVVTFSPAGALLIDTSKSYGCESTRCSLKEQSDFEITTKITPIYYSNAISLDQHRFAAVRAEKLSLERSLPRLDIWNISDPEAPVLETWLSIESGASIELIQALGPTTIKPTTIKPTTIKPTTIKPTTIKPTTIKIVTADAIIRTWRINVDQ